MTRQHRSSPRMAQDALRTRQKLLAHERDRIAKEVFFNGQRYLANEAHATILEMRTELGIVLLVVSCGNVSAPVDGAMIVGVPDSKAVRCDTAAAFGSPTRLDELSTTSDEYEPRLSPDELQVYFSRSGADSDLFVASRLSREGNFNPPQPVASLNTSSVELAPH